MISDNCSQCNNSLCWPDENYEDYLYYTQVYNIHLYYVDTRIENHYQLSTSPRHDQMQLLIKLVPKPMKPKIKSSLHEAYETI